MCTYLMSVLQASKLAKSVGVVSDVRCAMVDQRQWLLLPMVFTKSEVLIQGARLNLNLK